MHEGLDPYDCFDLFHSTHSFAPGANYCTSCGGTWKTWDRKVRFSGEEDVEVDPLLDGSTAPSGSSSAESVTIEVKTYRSTIRVPLRYRLQAWYFRHIRYRRATRILDQWERELAERVIHGDGQYRLAPGEPDMYGGVSYRMEKRTPNSEWHGVERIDPEEDLA